MTRSSRRIRRFVLRVDLIASLALYMYISSHGLAERHEFMSTTIFLMCVAFLLGSRMRVSWFTVLVVLGIAFSTQLAVPDAHSFLRYVLSVPWPVALFWTLSFLFGIFMGEIYCANELGESSGWAP